jgi:hypothetical protein
LSCSIRPTASARSTSVRVFTSALTLCNTLTSYPAAPYRAPGLGPHVVTNPVCASTTLN